MSELKGFTVGETVKHCLFFIGGLENVKSFLTPVSGTVFHARSHGSLHFVIHSISRINHTFYGSLSVKENQKWLKILPWKAKATICSA